MNTLSHAFLSLFLLNKIDKTIQISANVPTQSFASGLKADLYSTERNPSASSALLVGQLDRSSIRQSFSLTHIQAHKSGHTIQLLYYGSLLNVSQLTRAIAMEML